MTEQSGPESDQVATLKALRSQIDYVDAQLVELLGRRFELTRQVGQLKATAGIPARDQIREAEQTLRRARLGEMAGVDRHLVINLFNQVTRQVVAEHEALQESSR